MSYTPEGTNDNAIVAGLPERDGCPVLTRIKAFIVDQGTSPVLAHTFRNRRTGNPVDLSSLLSASGDSESSSSSSSSSSASADAPADGSAVVRIRQWMGDVGGSSAPILELDATVQDPANGTVIVEIPVGVTGMSGIYELHWAVKNGGGTPVMVDRGLLSVERSLFAPDDTIRVSGQGPPTIQELRMLMADSMDTDNPLLQDVEFGDEQILMGLWEPLQYWNQTPPPVRRYTTQDFPWRGAWASAALGCLCRMAAHFYRRNLLKGIPITDRAKEHEYMAEYQRRWDDWRVFVANKKAEINLASFTDHVTSPYYDMGVW